MRYKISRKNKILPVLRGENGRREMNSRRKGAEGERQLARKLGEFGYTARRGQQYSGANGDPDVVGLAGVHIECKRVEKLNIDEALSQSMRDAKENEVPIVVHRKNHTDWKVTMRLEDWIKLYRESNWGCEDVHSNC